MEILPDIPEDCEITFPYDKTKWLHEQYKCFVKSNSKKNLK